MGRVILHDLGPSETLAISQDLCLTGISLQGDWASVGASGQQREVQVWAELAGHESRGEVGTLSEAEPLKHLRPVVFVQDGILLRHDAAAATVRFYGHVPVPQPAPSAGGAEETAAVPDDGGEEDDANDEASTWVEFDPATEEYDAERNDSDNGEEDHEEESDDEEEESEPPRKGSAAGESSKRNRSLLPLIAAPPGSVVPDGEFLGPARFASVENTAGFMRIAAAEAGNQEGEREIIVLYRYTRFSKTWSGRRGVEACRRTKLHRLRFAVPPAGDMASSLAWAGASLGPLIYPALFRRQLQELWTNLAAQATGGGSIPPRATRLQVIVDAAILRREDHTAERMAHMRGALEAGMQEAWPELYHVGMELHLPEPVQREEEQRPAKRRKIANDVDEEEECSVCLDPMESGLAAWPGCRHVFHGACVENTLARSDMCPLCRNTLCRLAN